MRDVPGCRTFEIRSTFSETALSRFAHTGFKIPVRDDLKFLGWFDALKGGTRVRMGTPVTEEYERTLYAHWGQTVRFEAQGGTCKKSSMTAVVGETYTELTSASREGYIFQGWFDAPEGGNRVRIGMEVPAEAERILYAHWDGPWQVVQFDANGGTCSKESAKYRWGANYTGFKIPVRDDLPFLGWFDAPKGGDRVRIGMPVTEEYARTLYARWGQTIRFDAQGGTCRKTAMTAIVGETYTTLASASLAGHSFQGWYDAPEGGNRFRIGMVVPAIPELTLYAHWKANASGRGLDISGVAATRNFRRNSERFFIIRCETVAGTVYEIQWVPAFGAEWTVLKRWTADEDGESAVAVSVPTDSPTGFFRVATPGGE